jgi:hypothetical protein
VAQLAWRRFTWRANSRRYVGDLDAATRLAEQWVESVRSGVKFQVPWAISTLAVLRGARGERDEARRDKPRG